MLEENSSDVAVHRTILMESMKDLGEIVSMLFSARTGFKELVSLALLSPLFVHVSYNQ